MQFILTGNQNIDLAIVAASLIAFIVYRVTRCLEKRAACFAWAVRTSGGCVHNTYYICNGDHDGTEELPGETHKAQATQH